MDRLADKATSGRDFLDVSTSSSSGGSGDGSGDGVGVGNVASAPAAPAGDDGVSRVRSSAGYEAISDGSALSSSEIARLTDEIVQAIKTVYDPEIPVDIYELGLIYRIDVDDLRNVSVEMTLTAPGCPVAGEMPIWVQDAVGTVSGIGSVKVDLVFDPPWDISRMSDEARMVLNMW